MPLFTFEIARPGKAPVVAATMGLPDYKAVWCHVEALALKVGNQSGVSLRVRDAGGDIVILTGVGTALASIEKCRTTNCPLRQQLARRSHNLGNLRSSGVPPMQIQPVRLDRPQ
jgi:hypothetical protein